MWLQKDNMTKEYDFSKFEQEAPPAALGDNGVARLSGLAKDQVRAEALVEKLEEELKAAKKELKHIQEFQLPELMSELGVDQFATKDGIKISVKEAVRGSISHGNAPEAFKWLEEHGQANLIKRNFIIDFGKDEEKWANKFERDLAKRKKALNVQRKKNVAPMTLQAFVREELAKGTDLPLETFGVYVQRLAKVSVK